MDSSTEASTSRTPKPSNAFYTLYNELCRKEKVNAITTSKSVNRKSVATLNFSTERLRLEDWKPLLEALYNDASLRFITIRAGKTKYQFQPEIDTEDKARALKHKYAILWTDYMLHSLIQALVNSVKITRTLAGLELDGLPVSGQYLIDLCEAIKGNKSLTTLSLANCPIQDKGCSVVCSALPLNVKSLNLSGCDLTSESGRHIAKLIRNQQLKRYSSSWNSSLRYLEPDEADVSGIKHINLNCNLKFGDAGLESILKELKDDLWIKELDVQKCGITEAIAKNIFSTLEYNKSLETADFQNNDQLKPSTLEKIIRILNEKKTSMSAEGDVYDLTTMVGGLKTAGKEKTSGNPNKDKNTHEMENSPATSSSKTSQTTIQKKGQSKQVKQKEDAPHTSASDDAGLGASTSTAQENMPADGAVKKVISKAVAGNKKKQ